MNTPRRAITLDSLQVAIGLAGILALFASWFFNYAHTVGPVVRLLAPDYRPALQAVDRLAQDPELETEEPGFGLLGPIVTEGVSVPLSEVVRIVLVGVSGPELLPADAIRPLGYTFKIVALDGHEEILPPLVELRAKIGARYLEAPMRTARTVALFVSIALGLAAIFWHAILALIRGWDVTWNPPLWWKGE